MKKFLLILALFALVVPVVGIYAAEPPGLVPCQNNCTFLKIFDLIANIIGFFMLIAVPLCAMAITWGGIVLVLNPSNSTANGKAKEIITAAGLGLLIALAAYLIVDTLLNFFTGTPLSSLTP